MGGDGPCSHRHSRQFLVQVSCHASTPALHGGQSTPNVSLQGICHNMRHENSTRGAHVTRWSCTGRCPICAQCIFCCGFTSSWPCLLVCRARKGIELATQRHYRLLQPS